MRRLKAAAAVGWTLGAVAVASAQTSMQPPGTDRPEVIYVLPQAGGEPIGTHGATVFGGVTPNTVVPADQIAQQYSCVIRLDSNSDSNVNFYLLDSQSAVALLTSSALIDPVAKQVLDLSPERRWEQVVVNVTSAGSRLARVEVILRKAPGANYPADGARKSAAALIDRLKNAYATSAALSQKASQARIKPITDELAANSAKLDDLRRRERQIKDLSADLSVNGAGFGNASNQLANLRMQRGPLQSELARNKARLASMEPPAPAAKWEQAVKDRQKELDDVKASAKAGKATDEQVQDTESKLADAQAQLAQASQPQVADNGNPFFRSQIAQLKSTIADEETRLKQLEADIAKINDPKLLEQIDSLPDLQSQEFQARNKMSELQNRLEQARRSSRDDPEITVTVLDGSAP